MHNTVITRNFIPTDYSSSSAVTCAFNRVNSAVRYINVNYPMLDNKIN